MRLCVAGTILFALAAAAPWIVRSFGYQVFIPLLAASGLVTIVATRLAADVPVRTGLVVVLGFALAMRLALVVIDPLLSTDLYRYVWDGRVQAAGINPYAHVPADPALTALRDAAIYPNINRADYAVTAYPPVAQMFFLAVTRICRESVVAMRLAMVGCEIVIVAAIIDLLRRLGAAADDGRRLCVASARDLGDRQQRSRRGTDGRPDDARRVAAGAQARPLQAPSRSRSPRW